MSIARKLAENPHVNHMIRKNIYIHSVDCACEGKEISSGNNKIDGKNCYCNVNVDLMGTNKNIKTSIDQPTDTVRIHIDPKNFKSHADMNKLE